jgi:TDG/mug DNA glycosylase family protein
MPNHRVTEDWMGEPVVTLEDLLRPGLTIVCVGINPSRVSVEAGHYYQGRAGQRFFARLRSVGLIPAAPRGGEDDAAFEAGIGFTDVVKRPTASAKELRSAEYVHGVDLLAAKLADIRPKLILFTYKRAAQSVFGSFEGNGFVEGLQLAGTQVFIMPSPYESAATAARTLRHLQVSAAAFGRFSGLYEPGHLDRLRSVERA